MKFKVEKQKNYHIISSTMEHRGASPIPSNEGDLTPPASPQSMEERKKKNKKKRKAEDKKAKKKSKVSCNES